ncbi:hypothetical protein BP6252_08616 [Coleophoma cylindrospora]|uniref:Uncharacterized protein n=1 Tax=Coleophoma cylindrospora TaxID=1849047 RepID=A0A3D8R6I1_9HELO|nr:hypothetical protein BP6252_08616 [Coleophoma cylindrospora]
MSNPVGESALYEVRPFTLLLLPLPPIPPLILRDMENTTGSQMKEPKLTNPCNQAGDQKNVPQSTLEQEKKDLRFHEGQPHSHKALDSKDERSIANKLERETKRESEPEPESAEARASKQDPTLPAKLHGNEPSKGAKIDAELQAEEEAELKRKGKA